VKREVSYQWRLREVMVAHGMFTVTELVPLLHDRSIDLSASQVHRLASGTPERLPMPLPVLAALCDIFTCTPAELIATRAEDAPVRKTATGDGVVNLKRAAAETRTPATRGMSAGQAAKPPCARCGRAIGGSWAHWPEGYPCMTCRTHALETYGPCAGCGVSRLTPGIAPGGGRLARLRRRPGRLHLRGLRPGRDPLPPGRLRQLRLGRAGGRPARRRNRPYPA
jgi:DNA-binding Xre family transcriptional regulator